MKSRVTVVLGEFQMRILNEFLDSSFGNFQKKDGIPLLKKVS